VPPLHDARVGEVVAAAISGETVFLLGRLDRPIDDRLGTPGLLVVAVPHRDGRFRAVIAHATYSLEGDGRREGLGLDPAPGAGAGAVAAPEAASPGPGRPPGPDDLRAFRDARPFRPFLIRTASGERYPVRRPEEIMMPHEAGSLILFSPPGLFAEVDLADIAAVRAIAPDDPEAIEPAPTAGDEAGDGRGISADHRRLGARIDRVESDAHRIALDLRREIQEVDLELGRAIHRGSLDLRDEFQRGLRDHAGELVSLRFTSNFHGWLLPFFVIVLICAMFPAIWWSGTMDSKAHQHDLLLKRIEDDSIKRREAVDLRLDELEAAVRQARDRTTPAR
jgi:hypothetical protein